MDTETFRKIVQEEQRDALLEADFTHWLLDKAEDIAKGVINRRGEYQYARVFNDPSFRALAKKHGMSEKDFVSKVASYIKNDPGKYKKLLAYDVGKTRWAKFF